MKIYVWGIGYVASALLENELKDVRICGFIDRKASTDKNLMLNGIKVFAPEDVTDLHYDLILVATSYAKSVYQQAEKLGIDLSKMFFIYSNYSFVDLNQNYEQVKGILSADFICRIKHRYHVIRGMRCDELEEGILEKGTWRHGGGFAEDYTRIRTFELVCKEIQDANLIGNVAELGVFKGEFSQYLNRAFSDRVLYLFDTFDGFDDKEAAREKAKGNCGDAFINRFKETSIDIVMDKMDYPEKIIIRKGLFPDSLQGLEDNFVFVSIDVDFERSIYDGLQYFYPRLVNGGYIFVHDYNSASLMGVRKAVEWYERDTGVRLCKCPISDIEGTLIITK